MRAYSHTASARHRLANEEPAFVCIQGLCSEVQEATVQPMLKLRVFDDDIKELIVSGAVRLLDAAWLRTESENFVMKRRQRMEADESEGSFQPYLSTEQALNALSRGNRGVGVLSYGWAKYGNPDPSGGRYRALRNALKHDCRCKDISALFWDYPCLYQWPRVPEHDMLFEKALTFMGDLYASPVGTTVLRMQFFDRCPQEYESRISIINTSVDKYKVQSTLSSVATCTILRTVPHAKLRGIFTYDVKLEVPHAQAMDVVRRLRQKEHDELKEVLGPAEDEAFACAVYNDTEYMKRGWCLFETGAAAGALWWIDKFPSVRALISDIRTPKLLDLDHNGDVTAVCSEDIDFEFESMRQRIMEAEFTNGQSDRVKVKWLYDQYQSRLMRSVNDISTDIPCDLINEAGHGTRTWLDGTIYEGTFVHGKMHGFGKLTEGAGTQYEGEFKNDMKDGFGRRTWPDGAYYVGQWHNSMRHGQGQNVFPNGGYYSGNWHMDKKDGDGVLLNLNREPHKFFIANFKANKIEGPATVYYDDGSVEVSNYERDLPVEDAVRWGPDRDQAWLTRRHLAAGQVATTRQEISITESTDVAHRIGLPVPTRSEWVEKRGPEHMLFHFHSSPAHCIEVPIS